MGTSSPTKGSSIVCKRSYLREPDPLLGRNESFPKKKSVFPRSTGTTTSYFASPSDVLGTTETNTGRASEAVDVFSDISNISLPTEAWNWHNISLGGVRNICLVEMQASPSNAEPYPKKVLHLLEGKDGNLVIKSFILDKEVCVPTLPRECSIKDLDIICQVLLSFDSMNLCSSGPIHDQFIGVNPECAHVDKTGVWRHNCCTLIDEVGAQCSACKSLSNTLRIHKARQQKRKKMQQQCLHQSP